MRKWTALFIAVCMFVLYLPAAALAAKPDSSSWLDLKNLNQGVIGIAYESGTKATKLMVTKDGVNYTYNLAAAGKEEFFPLQLGNGAYTLSILERVTDNRYKSVYNDSVDLQVKDAAGVYLNSIQNINYNEAEAVVEKARELTQNKKTDQEKVKAIYDYIVNTVTYDFNLAANVQTGYIPDLDSVLTSGKGICYDYASLFAAMNRSVGVPTKLLMGSSEHVKEYHAWNEVYLDGKWQTVDTTVDAGTGSQTLVKNAAEYKAAKVY
ncbi:transglutaminase-like domain-containing protein [Paenibacillus filicis]|uniref:Transglutaminase-like domain-containing protein n=1 Tax=Paenibacillus filicis TaxID=669464 RepID=A0ABU9DVQ6_9BACL